MYRIPDGHKFHKVLQDIARSSLQRRSTKVADVNLQDFDIQMQLGQGTFGRVYLAVLPTTGQKYAIKAIRKDVLLEYD